VKPVLSTIDWTLPDSQLCRLLGCKDVSMIRVEAAKRGATNVGELIQGMKLREICVMFGKTTTWAFQLQRLCGVTPRGRGRDKRANPIPEQWQHLDFTRKAKELVKETGLSPQRIYQIKKHMKGKL
jgi:hypothetical protein